MTLRWQGARTEFGWLSGQQSDQRVRVVMRAAERSASLGGYEGGRAISEFGLAMHTSLIMGQTLNLASTATKKRAFH